MQEITVSGGELEKVAVDEMAKKIEMGISSRKQMARTELNYYCELLCALKETNSLFDDLTRLYTLANADELRNAFSKNQES